MKHATNFLSRPLQQTSVLLWSEEDNPQPHHTGMSYSKQHYILHDEQGIYTNTGQHGHLLHLESQAEAGSAETQTSSNQRKIKPNNLVFKCFKTQKKRKEFGMHLKLQSIWKQNDDITYLAHSFGKKELYIIHR